LKENETSNIQFSLPKQSHKSRDTFLFHRFFYVKLTADSPETQIWCSKMCLWFCNIRHQSYEITLHIDQKL